MVIVSFQESLAGRPVKSSRREFGTPTAALNRFPQSPSSIDSQLRLPNPWDSRNSPATSHHVLSLSNEPILDPRSPVSTGCFSPDSFKEESVSPRTISLCLRNASTVSLKRKSDEDDDGNDNNSVPLPGFQSLLPYHEPHGRSHTTSPLWTPNTTPEPSEGDVYSGRPSLSLAQDPITEGLNRLRIKQNKEPLPPLEALCNNIPRFPIPETPWTKWKATQHVRGEPSQPSSPEVRRRRVKSAKPTHCNIKYLVEELDYIRYQRVDYGQKWALVQSSFIAMFPTTVFPLLRETQGLQGACYRQNKFLPRIHHDQLVFMENGHVEAVCVKTREQTEKKHLYTLIYLFPDRAMSYPWVSSLDRQRARELDERRQLQMVRGRLQATGRGTYIEKLPSDVPCGCCHSEDRERCPEKRAENKSSPVEDEYMQDEYMQDEDMKDEDMKDESDPWSRL
ncbi:hypothetical protein F4782DRAFT_530652 [Xylaria castorea]|nr:hypothetical protein F4782DRAFT_530652 [Xylaria castorea]